jgi:hypothetical protein
MGPEAFFRALNLIISDEKKKKIDRIKANPAHS